jgi:hypothetical protein
MTEQQLLVGNALERLGFSIDPMTANSHPRYPITSDILKLLNEAAGKSIVVGEGGEIRIE